MSIESIESIKISKASNFSFSFKLNEKKKVSLKITGLERPRGLDKKGMEKKRGGGGLWHVTLKETMSLADSIDSGNLSVRGYLPLIQKDSTTLMHGLTVNMKERLPFTLDLSLEKSVNSYVYVFDWLYFIQCLTSFPSISHLLCLYTEFFRLFHLRTGTWRTLP